MSNKENNFWPFIVFMPIDVDKRALFLSTLFSSKITIDVLRLFKWDEDLCQSDIVKSLRMHSNKTVIAILKKLASLSILSEKYRVEKRGKRRVKVKCYRLTELGKWYNLLFRDPQELDRDTVKIYLTEIVREFIEKITSFASKFSIPQNSYIDIADIVRSFLVKPRYKDFDVIVFGSNALDVYITHSYKIFFGGSGANVAVALSRLGLKTGFVSRFSTDVIGLQSAYSIAREGVDISLSIFDENAEPSICSIVHGDKIKIECRYDRGRPPVVTELSEKIVEACRRAKAVYLGEGINNLYVKLIREIGGEKLIVYRPNMEAIQYFLEEVLLVFRQSPIVILNEDKAELFSRKGFDIPKTFYDHGIKHLIITLGSRGAEIYSYPRTEPKKIESPQTVVLDPIGAGDMFSAVFIYMLLRELDIEKAVEKAVKTASTSLSQLGPRKLITINSLAQ
ncbi:MAG: carbohydrate kinase family protein [Ignisphaera sp.]